MAGKAETDSRTGVKAEPVNIDTFPGSPALCLPARSPASRSLAEGRRYGEGRGGKLHFSFINEVKQLVGSLLVQL